MDQDQISGMGQSVEASAASAAGVVNMAPSAPNAEGKRLSVEEIIQNVMNEHPLKGFEVDIRDLMQNLVIMSHANKIWENTASFQQFRMLAELIAIKMKQYERKLCIATGTRYVQILTADEIEEQFQEGSFTLFRDGGNSRCMVHGDDSDKE